MELYTVHAPRIQVAICYLTLTRVEYNSSNSQAVVHSLTYVLSTNKAYIFATKSQSVLHFA